MKKKRSIQKLKVNKETISNLNTVVGGDVTAGVRALRRITARTGSLDTHCNTCYFNTCAGTNLCMEI